jgi:putative hydrolase of the HAD superfamily
MSDYHSKQSIARTFKTQIDNLPTYGYGIKGYILSMIEAAMTISNSTITIEVVGKLSNLVKN